MIGVFGCLILFFCVFDYCFSVDWLFVFFVDGECVGQFYQDYLLCGQELILVVDYLCGLDCYIVVYIVYSEDFFIMEIIINGLKKCICVCIEFLC